MDDTTFARAMPNQGFERRWNQLMLAVELFVGLNICAGLLGLFGTGPLSRASVGIANPAAQVRYERVTRRTLASDLVFDLTAPLADDKVEIELPRDFLRGVDVTSSSPRASRMAADRDGVLYRFDLGPSRQGEIRFTVKPRSAGFVNSSIKIDSGGRTAEVALKQIILP